ncbi:hypothetical protein evm_015100 [Chilo suppressalis]|nr:hypothetical protein evm_015100 [Chilo suppressalis]
MNLRKWSANNNDLVTDLDSNQIDAPFQFKCSDSRKTLGLQWQPATDTFTFQNKLDCDKQCCTKRQLLSDISKVFDPLGWITPVTVKAKLLFQRAWSSGTSWDSNLPVQIQNEWEQLRNDFKNINKISIPRYIGNIQGAYQIYGFCDASEKAFACVVYIVTQNDKGEFTPVLVTAKTRLAPLNKQISLPRLELCGALPLAQLISKVKDSYKLADDLQNTFAWTDSMVVLGWIHGDISRWKQFVANRISQIIKIVPPSQWLHVRSEDNPADCASRGLTVTSLLEHNLWWQGPKWITNHKNSYDQSEYEQPTLELKNSKSSVNAALYEQQLTLFDKLLADNNSITKTVRIIAWISRSIAQLRNRSGNINNYLLSAELNEAYFIIIKYIQANEFETDLINLKNKGHVQHKSKIAPLHPFLDDHGIIRVGGRLNYSNLNSSAKHPVILSSHSRFTDLIVEQAHLTTLHGGPRLTLSFIREKYWVVSGMRTVKRILRKPEYRIDRSIETPAVLIDITSRMTRTREGREGQAQQVPGLAHEVTALWDVDSTDHCPYSRSVNGLIAEESRPTYKSLSLDGWVKGQMQKSSTPGHGRASSGGFFLCGPNHAIVQMIKSVTNFKKVVKKLTEKNLKYTTRPKESNETFMNMIRLDRFLYITGVNYSVIPEYNRCPTKEGTEFY